MQIHRVGTHAPMMPNGSRLPENAVGNTRLPLSDMLFASSYKEITEGLNVRGVKMKDGVVRDVFADGE